MKEYKIEKYLKTETDNLDEGIVQIYNSFKKALGLIQDLTAISSMDIDEYEMEDRLSNVLSPLDDILRKFNTKPIYRDMIRCGIKTALKNINYTNRERIGY